MPGFELIGKEEKAAVNEIFDNGGVLFRHGFEDRRNGIYKVNDFEKAFVQKFKTGFSRAVSSGTAALLVALKALGVKKGDEVITQSFTFVATVEAIIEAGAVPIIAEVNKTLNMDPEDLKKKITVKTKVIIPVHMMGVSCQMKEIMNIAKKHDLLVLEDTAQALGGKYKDKYLGTMGDAGIFSFDFGKGLTTGEGGMVISKNKEIYLRAKEYSDHGHQENPNFPRGDDTRRMSGFNFSMNELQGSVGLAQLKKFDYIMKKQKENKREIKVGISSVPGIEFRELPDIKGDCGDTLIFFVRDKKTALAAAKKLAEKGIGIKNIPSAFSWHFAGTWDYMLSSLKNYRGKDLMKQWPVSADIVSRAIALPIMVKMDVKQINKIIGAVKEIARDLKF